MTARNCCIRAKSRTTGDLRQCLVPGLRHLVLIMSMMININTASHASLHTPMGDPFQMQSSPPSKMQKAQVSILSTTPASKPTDYPFLSPKFFSLHKPWSKKNWVTDDEFHVLMPWERIPYKKSSRPSSRRTNPYASLNPWMRFPSNHKKSSIASQQWLSKAKKDPNNEPQVPGAKSLFWDLVHPKKREFNVGDSGRLLKGRQVGIHHKASASLQPKSLIFADIWSNLLEPEKEEEVVILISPQLQGLRSGADDAESEVESEGLGLSGIRPMRIQIRRRPNNTGAVHGSDLESKED